MRRYIHTDAHNKYIQFFNIYSSQEENKIEITKYKNQLGKPKMGIFFYYLKIELEFFYFIFFYYFVSISKSPDLWARSHNNFEGILK